MADKSPDDFYHTVIGKAYDLDGMWGATCVDGYGQYSIYLGYPRFRCTQTNFAKDIWNLRKESGILEYYEELQAPFQDGDVVIWDNCAECPDSHIAIFRKDAGDNKGVFLGQNQDGTPDGKGGASFDQKVISYNGILGGLRPKIYKEQKDKLDRLPSSVNGLSRINSASNNAILESGREAPYVQEIAVQRPDFC